jgi:Sin3 family co-repressor
MCRSALNDEWVTHPTWSNEDSGFLAPKKNVYEEALHRSEEDRHEYDFHIEAIVRTISMLEPINNKITHLLNEERGSFKLKANLEYTPAGDKEDIRARGGVGSYTTYAGFAFICHSGRFDAVEAEGGGMEEGAEGVE